MPDVELNDEVVDQIVKSMGSMRYGDRPPSWVLVFPARDDEKCLSCSSQRQLSYSDRDNILKEVLSNPIFFEKSRDSQTKARGGYKYFDSVFDLDASDEKLDVTDQMREIYRNALQAETMFQFRQHLLQLLLEYLLDPQCGLNARVFSSKDGSEIFVAISASEKCLVVTADNTDYQLRFRQDVTKGFLGDFANQGDINFYSDEPYVVYDLQEDFQFRARFRADNGFGCSPFCPAQDDPKILERKALAFEGGSCMRVSCQLSNEDSPADAEDDQVDAFQTIFRSIDRIRLVRALIEKLFSIDALEDEGIVSVAYCCHDQFMRHRLEYDWASLKNLFSLYLPLDEIRDYCGENIAFRFAFMQFVLVSILPLAILGIFARHVPKAIPVIPIFCVLMFVWMQLMQKYWSRREAKLRQRWGMEATTSGKAGEGVAEEVRAKFKGKWELSEVNGYQEVKVADQWQPFRSIIASVLSSMGIGLMLVVQILMLYWKIKTNPGALEFSVLNALQVHMFRAIWHKAALWLTNFENHRTQIEFNSTYSARIFWFMFLNTMTNFSYLAYIKVFVTGCDAEAASFEQYFYTREFGKCGSELAFSLIALFLLDLALEIREVVPILKSPKLMLLTLCPCLRRAKGDTPVGYRELHPQRGKEKLNGLWYHPGLDECKPGYVELQRHMPDFDFDVQALTRARNFVDICIIAFFGMIIPEMVSLFALGLLLRMRLFGRRLVHVMRRAYPLAAAGIAYWSLLIGRVFIAAAICNMFSLVFHYSRLPEENDLFLPLKNIISTPTATRDKDWKTMLAVALFLENAIILPIILGVRFYVADEEKATALHRMRRKHIAWAYNKVLSNTKEKGEMQMVRDSYDPCRLLFLKTGEDEGVEWQRLENENDIASLVQQYKLMPEGTSNIASCAAGGLTHSKNLAAGEEAREDRLFATPTSSPWGLDNCCL